MRNMTARAEAKKTGAKYYDSGQPCKNGHTALRATLSGSCVACTQAAAQAWVRARPGKAAEYTAKHRVKNPDKVRQQDAASIQARRAADPGKYAAISKAQYRKRAQQEGREVWAFNKLPETDLVQRLAATHGAAVEYVSGYRTMLQTAVFRCPKHNLEVSAQPHNVLRGASPCPRCNHTKSKAEQKIADMLAAHTPVVQRDRTLLKPKELDMYLPEKKLAVEYCGMYWHSHWTAEIERRDHLAHTQKYEACKALGIRLLTVFESEWNERGPAVRRLLRNATGTSRGKLMARKCTLAKVDTPEARTFYEKYHPQGGAGYGEHYGLYWGNKLVACMRFTYGVNDRGVGAAGRVWTLARYATRVTVAGGASRLFKAFLEDQKPKEVKSFSDNRYFDGGMYARLGFILDAEIPADYQVWSPKIGLRSKSHYQRRLLPARMAEHGMPGVFDPATDSRTELEMTYAMGCGRIYDCGKKRWVWRDEVEPQKQ